jgi:hypothetical protein
MMGFEPLGPAWKGAGGGTIEVGAVVAFGEVEEVVPPRGPAVGAVGGTAALVVPVVVVAGWIGCGAVGEEDSAIG